MLSCLKFRVVPSALLPTPKIKLILYEGSIRVLKGRSKMEAGEIMFEFPDCVVCHADSFFLGRPIPILGIHDELMASHSYFVIPLDTIPSSESGGILSASSLSSLGSSPSSCPSIARQAPVIKFCGDISSGNDTNKSPFEYVKDKEGRAVVIKVVPEFIMKVITSNYSATTAGLYNCNNISNSPICSTPELQKEYEQLVKAKDQGWSPNLETIYEYKIRFSPCRFIGLKGKHNEK
uniref:Uncharacterized protein n=1 Tax=Opuntia streptacantha TaxID=393608 RepID=A0A7C8ZD24_OPUST